MTSFFADITKTYFRLFPGSNTRGRSTLFLCLNKEKNVTYSINYWSITWPAINLIAANSDDLNHRPAHIIFDSARANYLWLFLVFNHTTFVAKLSTAHQPLTNECRIRLIIAPKSVVPSSGVTRIFFGGTDQWQIP